MGMGPAEEVARPREVVFAYGSLLELAKDAAEVRAEATRQVSLVDGYRRTWGVAMDNARTLPGYKYYVDPRTGERPAVFVVFLDIVADRSGQVNGVMLDVSHEELDGLDRRERNYERVEVTAGLSRPVSATVWAYAGTAGARERFRRALRMGKAVISEDYYDRVLGAFAGSGRNAAAEFRALTDAPPCPIVPLRRVDLSAT